MVAGLHNIKILIYQNQSATATGRSDFLDGQISHDKMTRFSNGKEPFSKERKEFNKHWKNSNSVFYISCAFFFN